MTDYAELAKQFGGSTSSEPDYAALAKQFGGVSAKPEMPQGGVAEAIGEPLLAMGTGMIAKPIADMAGLARLGMEGWRRAGIPFISERDPQTVQQDVLRALTYSPRTTVGQATTEYNPLALLGKGVNWLASQAESAVAPQQTSGPLRSAIGYGVNELVNQAPTFLGMKAPAAAAATEAGLSASARNWMQSALKPPIAELRTGKAARAIDTLLDEGINVTQGGVAKMSDRIDALNADIAQRIQAYPAIIDKNAVASRLQGLMDRFAKQVNPLSDVAAIQRAWDEFINHPMLSGNAIPVGLAQEMKQATYRSLGDKAYGELKGADIEAQKTLARGLKEEIADAVPEVRALNAEESNLLNALSLTERRVLISANKNPIGLGWLTTNPVKFAGFMADRSELFKSLVARMLNTGAKATPDMTVVGPLGGAAITSVGGDNAQK